MKLYWIGGFLGGSDGKKSACSVGDLELIPGLGRSPGGGHGNTLQYFCLENPHRKRSLVGYSPWGHKELDTTEQLSLSLVHCWQECKLVQPLWKTVWRFIKELTVELPYDLAGPLLGSLLKKTKTLT